MKTKSCRSEQCGRIPTTRTVVLSPEERAELEQIVRRGTAEHRLVQRARMVLMRADEVDVLEIARRLMVHRNNVWRWCDRFNEKRIDGLRDRPRPGRPPSLSRRSNALI